MQFRHINNGDMKHFCTFDNMLYLFDNVWCPLHEPRPMVEHILFNIFFRV